MSDTTKTRTTITLDPEAHRFLESQGGDNKSAFVNQLLKDEQRRRLQLAIIKANMEEANDPEYLSSLEDWELTLEDGLDVDV